MDDQHFHDLNMSMMYGTYENALELILEHGRFKGDRTGTGTTSIFGHQMRFDLKKGFPLITTKKVFMKGIVHELLWFLRGETNIKYLVDNGVHIWDEWADANGDLGPVYGSQWRAWPTHQKCKNCGGVGTLDDAGMGDIMFNTWDCLECKKRGEQVIDQIANVMKSLRDNPNSRRHIVSAWNPAEVDQMALPPCHALFQFYVDDLTVEERWNYSAPGLETKDIGVFHPTHEDVDAYMEFIDGSKVPRKRLSCQLYQRSCDMFLGVPFNIASYALLTHMFAQQLGYAVGDFIWTGGDCHIYSNHMEQVKLQLSRTPRQYPTLKLNKAKDIFSYAYEDIQIVGYDPHPHIPGKVAV